MASLTITLDARQGTPPGQVKFVVTRAQQDAVSEARTRRATPMPVRPLMTLHAPMAANTADTILRPAIEAMDAFGFRWWFDPSALPNLHLMIECPQEWCDRGPTRKEVDHFYELYERDVDEARKFAAEGGFPPDQR